MMLCSVSIFSCAKQEPTVKHVMKAGEGPNLKNVKVVNEDDPGLPYENCRIFKRYNRL